MRILTDVFELLVSGCCHCGNVALREGSEASGDTAASSSRASVSGKAILSLLQGGLSDPVLHSP